MDGTNNQRSRCSELLDLFPGVTLGFTALCCTFAVYTMAGEGDLGKFSISPIQVGVGVLAVHAGCHYHAALPPLGGSKL